MISDGRGITLPCPFQNFRGLAAPRVGKSSSTGPPLGFDTAGAPHGDGAEVVAGVGAGVGAPHPGGALGFEGATGFDWAPQGHFGGSEELVFLKIKIKLMNYGSNFEASLEWKHWNTLIS